MVKVEDVQQTKYHISTPYLYDIFNGYNKRQNKVSLIIKSVRAFERKYKIHIHYLVVRGMSGVTIGSIVAHKMKKSLIIVRKRGEKTHSSNQVEGLPYHQQNGIPYNALFIDDCVDTGETLLKTLEEIKVQCGPIYALVRVCGVCVYNQYWSNFISKNKYCGQTVFTLEEMAEELSQRYCNPNFNQQYKKWVM